jgi:hypothetical protein
MHPGSNRKEKSMLKYTAIPAVFAMAALLHPGLAAAGKGADLVQSSYPVPQTEQAGRSPAIYCRVNKASDTPSTDLGSHLAGTPFTVDYMTANGNFFSLKRLFACTSHIHRARIS